MNILAIESSCDETAAAVVRDGYEVLSDVISSQAELHKKYGGVVPEIASRKHLECISQVADEALEQAGVNRRASGRGFVCEGTCVRLEKATHRGAPYQSASLG